ncbi:mitochondrial carrier domain-containing protein [Phycomyces blakesleeanus]|uniref:Mitochondrial carrier domain-containing protein n=1 Tax=Phycomyces blakesleeanus TaxID=4837 RepID=A0ABR3AMD5_PHYBL
MTLTAYLGLLSPGCSIDNEQGIDSDRLERQVNRSRLQAQAILDAELSFTNTVIKHCEFPERRETRESIATLCLLGGSMVANYALCFPVVVARHRYQAFPAYYSSGKDTPWGSAKFLLSTARRDGIRALYPGFGLGLVGQAVAGAYELLLSEFFQTTIAPATAHLGLPWRFLIQAVERSAGFAINIALYPLHRTALVMRVQSNSEMTRRCILGYKDFMAAYKSNLVRFIPWRHDSSSNSLPLMSSFVPSCIVNTLTEKLLLYLYKRVYRVFTLGVKTPAKPSRSRRREDRSSPKPKRDDVAMLNTFYPEIACGVASSILARAISYPIDTVMFKLMLQDSGVHKINTTYRGFFDCVHRTWRDEGGIKAFYVGWGAGVLEIVAGYLILEASWFAYRAVEWKLGNHPSGDDHRLIRKARRIRDRLQRDKQYI